MRMAKPKTDISSTPVSFFCFCKNYFRVTLCLCETFLIYSIFKKGAWALYVKMQLIKLNWFFKAIVRFCNLLVLARPSWTFAHRYVLHFLWRVLLQNHQSSQLTLTKRKNLLLRFCIFLSCILTWNWSIIFWQVFPMCGCWCISMHLLMKELCQKGFCSKWCQQLKLWSCYQQWLT